jgi:hypothetical protein
MGSTGFDCFIRYGKLKYGRLNSLMDDNSVISIFFKDKE